MEASNFIKQPAVRDTQVKSSGFTEVSLESLICETELAKYFYAHFKWNHSADPELVYAVEDLRGETTGITIKSCLDLYRDTVLKKSQKAAEYREVIPMTLDCYMDELRLSNGHSVILYKITEAGNRYALRSLILQPEEKLPIGTVIWLTERLLRVAEALHADDIILELNRPIYLVNLEVRTLKLMDFRHFRYTKQVGHCDVRKSLSEIAEVVRGLGDFDQEDAATKSLDEFLKRCENPDQDATVASMREEFLQDFPNAK